MSIAFILINCEMGNELQVIPSLKKYCNEISGTYGIYDFIGKLKYVNMDEFEESLKKITNLLILDFELIQWILLMLI